jgi:hypothetical protein
VLGYHIAWPYRCEPVELCPDAGPWRVLRLEVEGTGGQEGLKVRRVARRLVDSIRAITNALPPTRATVAEEPGLFKYVAWMYCTPSRERATATLVSGLGSKTVAKVVLEVEGAPPVEVPTFRRKGFPFSFWVVAPLPPDARPRSFTSFDAAGRQLAREPSSPAIRTAAPDPKWPRRGLGT